MKLRDLAIYLDKLERISSRIEITKILADLFQKSDKDEIEKIVYLILGGLAPGYRGIVFNIADQMMLQAFAKAYGKDLDKIKTAYKEKGDLGDLAQYLAKEKSNKSESGLKVLEVYDALQKIAQDEGEGSQERKVLGMASLLERVDPLGARFLARIPVGKLRLGFSDKTVLDALSWMETGNKEGKSALETAYNVLPDVGLLAKHTKELGTKKAAKNIVPIVGVPLLPALAARLKSPKEMINKMTEVAVEPKFDGLRIQLHYKKSGFKGGGNFKAFTRNLNETSWMFPELENLGNKINANEAILDSEAVGVDEARKTLANFQTTMTRRRKHDISDMAKKVKIRFCVFDCLHKDGISLIDKPYLERRRALANTLQKSDILKIVDYVVTKDPLVIEKEMKRNLAEGMEGIIVKRISSGYVAGRTGWRWVKMKEGETSRAKLSDTIDAVVMGYYRGRGKRTTFGLGGFLVGIMDGEVIKTLTKIGTGLTDQQFRELKKRLEKFETKDKPKEFGEVNKLLLPDVWVLPGLVVEIAADEITKSPTHSSGYALRFPRLVRFRDDKSIGEATKIKELQGIKIG